jgi:hypothetical protein
MLTRPRYPNLFHRRLESIDENQQNTATNVDRVVTRLDTSIAKADDLADRVASLAPQLNGALTALQEIAENTKRIGMVEVDRARLARNRVFQSLTKYLAILARAEHIVATSDNPNPDLATLSGEDATKRALEDSAIELGALNSPRFVEVLKDNLGGQTPAARRQPRVDRLMDIRELGRDIILHFASH